MARARSAPRAHRRHALVAIVVAAALALAGCTNRAESGTDDQTDPNLGDDTTRTSGTDTTSQAPPASLSFEGTGDETDSATIDCPTGNAILRASGDATGTMNLMVSDASGNVIWGEIVSDGDLSYGPAPIDGQAGEWTLEVERSNGFDGHYAATLRCQEPA